MRELPLRTQHGVLMRPEQREHLVDELPQPLERAGAGGGPGAIRWCAEEIGTPAFDIDHHPGIERVEPIANGLGPAAPIGGRRLTILIIEVPTTTCRFRTIHEYAGAGALPSIEVLHAHGASIGGPGGEFTGRTDELLVRQNRDCVAGQHLLTVEGHRTHRHHPSRRELSSMLGQSGAQRCRHSQVDLEALLAEFKGETAQ